MEAPPPAPLVLLVEDDPDGRVALRRVLELLGYAVAEAADGPAGVAAGLARRPDYAVVDIGLPGHDGFEVARRLRAEFGPGLRLIALTAYSDAQSRALADEAGFDAYFVKPADLDELVTQLGGGPGVGG